MAESCDRLRVAFVAGTLDLGGAEKQLVYQAGALAGAGVDVRVYSLTRGEFYERALQQMGLQPIWIGAFANPIVRLAILANFLRRFRPHVIQSGHSFVNLYVALAGRFRRAISVGALRSSLRRSRERNGAWTRWQIGTPTALLINSQTALSEVVASGLIHLERLHLIPNVIELTEVDRLSSLIPTRAAPDQSCTAIFVGRLTYVKRPDRFLRALAIACERFPTLEGVVVGDGPGREAMEKLAIELGLRRHGIRFLGQREDVSTLLRRSDMLILCSDDEGFPNVLLEAMAARVPVITTPAGDASIVVQDGITGYVVPFDDAGEMAERMVRLAQSPDLRRQLGEAGRRRVENDYDFNCLGDRLLAAYRTVAQRSNSRHVLTLLSDKVGPLVNTQHL